jgi:hypothetical protein
LLQSESVPVAPGQAVGLYLSGAARRRSFVLQSTAGSPVASAPLALEAITQNVFRVRIPLQTPAGTYEVAARVGRGRPAVAGRITVGPVAARAAPGPVAGRFLGRLADPAPSGLALIEGSRSASLRFVLASRTLQDVVLVFRWRLNGLERSNALWVTGDRTLSVATTGRCGNFPYDAGGAPPAGTRVEVSQLGADGAPGPWTAYAVPTS